MLLSKDGTQMQTTNTSQNEKGFNFKQSMMTESAPPEVNKTTKDNQTNSWARSRDPPRLSEEQKTNPYMGRGDPGTR